MYIASCRDFDDPGDGRDKWQYGAYHWMDIESNDIHPIKSTRKNFIILVHGFNTDNGKAIKAYKNIRRICAKLPGWGAYELLGFTWPSEGSFARYFSDMAHVKRSIHALAKVVSDITKDNVNSKVSLIGHSMGAQLILQSILNPEMPTGKVHRVVLHGADIIQKRVQRWNKYGRNVADNIQRLLCLYSPHDRVLRYPAKIRPFPRLGQVGLPKYSPDNYIDKNISEITGIKFRHADYKTVPQVWELTTYFCFEGR